jgi:hypothetical protein
MENDVAALEMCERKDDDDAGRSAVSVFEGCGIFPCVSSDDNDDDQSDSTGLLSRSTGSSKGSIHTEPSSDQRSPEPAVVQDTPPAAKVSQEAARSSRKRRRSALVPQGELQGFQAIVPWPAQLMVLAAVCFLCGHAVKPRGTLYYAFNCTAWFCLSVALVACSCYGAYDDVDEWLSAHPQKKTFAGGVLSIQSILCSIRDAPHANSVDAVIAIWATFHACIGQKLTQVVHPLPRVSALFCFWFSLHHLAQSVHFFSIAFNFEIYAHTLEDGYDARLAWIRGVSMCALALLRFVWFERQADRFRITNGASGTSSTQALTYSFYGFWATMSFCNAVVGAYLLGVGNAMDGLWLLGIAMSQGVPVLVVATVGRACVQKRLIELDLESHLFDLNLGARGTSRGEARGSRLGLGEIVVAGLLGGARADDRHEALAHVRLQLPDQLARLGDEVAVAP